MLEADGDEGHDGKEDGEDLPDRVAGGEGHPDRETDEPVAPDRPDEGLDEGEADFGVGDLHRGRPESPVARFPQARQVEEENEDDRADEVRNVHEDPPLEHDAEGDVAREGARDHEVVAGEELSPCDHDEHEADAEDRPSHELREPDAEMRAHIERYDRHQKTAESDVGAREDAEHEAPRARARLSS